MNTKKFINIFKRKTKLKISNNEIFATLIENSLEDPNLFDYTSTMICKIINGNRKITKEVIYKIDSNILNDYLSSFSDKIIIDILNELNHEVNKPTTDNYQYISSIFINSIDPHNLLYTKKVEKFIISIHKKLSYILKENQLEFIDLLSLKNENIDINNANKRFLLLISVIILIIFFKIPIEKVIEYLIKI